MMSDPSLISILLLHLVENALHFSPADSRIQLVVSAKPQHILFEVLDRGPGIPFLLAAPTSQTPGTIPHTHLPKRRGLGLYIAQMIATIHNGSLSLSPRQDGGTIAQLLIPNR
jgi:K+-sensing histidine kinase KdpD